MTRRESYGLLAAIVLFGAAACLPFVDSGYGLSLGVTIAMYTVLSTSWTLFSGPTHYISLATAAFFGLGMYVVGGGLEMLPFAALVGIAALVGALLAALVGLATLRLSGVYFVIFTLGLAELIRQLMTWGQTTLGTSSGLYVLTDVDEKMIYWQLLVLAAFVYLIGWWINRSRLGFALRIIGNDEVVATHSGINTALTKVFLFMISGTIAAVTGAILAPRWTYIEPTIAFSPMLSFLVVIMALIGGAHRLWGPLFGVIPFTLAWDLITAKFPNQTALMLGIAFLLIVYVIPHGFVGLAEKYWAKYRMWRA
ncbi:MAG TPA: branched-chain amino acid ABC transporter permease [Alphaproteobacteria bacterium]|jgi:branched-chain amino acid transport system permease protein|nr:branched-chain amino acid ABC transporter permease [Alphaproteobacteria bacterium]MDP6269003.1 branched-chain amino acid ABC transporter permease [Alphaproteobacteria bacterium]HJM48294.1 branched-chain amino acid ABC transporter permease [Alphaproteobacteria bacterium]